MSSVPQSVRPWLPLAIVAVVVAASLGFAQSDPGHAVLRSWGISSPSQSYTELAFTNPDQPWTRTGHRSLQTSFWVHNVEGAARTYHWTVTTRVSGAAAHAVASGHFPLANGASRTLSLVVPAICAAARQRVDVSLDGAGETIGFWVGCVRAAT